MDRAVGVTEESFISSFAQKIEHFAADSSNKIGLVLVDHGSRRQQSNDLLDEVAVMFRRISGFELVEPAHMELAEPSIETAFGRCVERGATLVVVCPYFLAPGRHWSQDIPALAKQAAAKHSGVRHLVTAPLGLHEAMATILQDRILQCVQRTLAAGEACDLCDQGGGCQLL